MKSWSLPDHLCSVSGWSAICKNKKPSSCKNQIGGPYFVDQFDNAVAKELAGGTTAIDLAWDDLTWLLFTNHVRGATTSRPESSPTARMTRL